MTISAIVLDSNLEPISDDIEIVGDDYSTAEQFAADAAAGGTKCCIQWTRSDDGQTAFWGPGGAVFAPHWYSRRGRPPLAPELRAESTHPRSVRLTDDEWAELQRRGVRGGKGSLAHWLASKVSPSRI